MKRLRCDQTTAWQRLQQCHTVSNPFDLHRVFAQETQRWQQCSLQAPYLFADWSKSWCDAPTQATLLELAQECQVLQYRDAMFAGEAINTSEQRPALHTLLRNPEHNAATQAIHASLDAFLSYAEQVRASGITDIVNIGIGGSKLGPEMVITALEAELGPRRFHFVCDADNQDLELLLPKLHPERTLFLVSSKTFGTTETLSNATRAKLWFETQGGTDFAKHFVALTAHPERAHAWGIERSFTFGDSVGGRYSVWSAIGLPVAIAIGAQGFREFLAGAYAMDQHFQNAEPAQNLPLRLGLLDVWYRNFHQFQSRCVAPYHPSLRRWLVYLQQLEMESNGKHVDTQGQTLSYATSPILWGEIGTQGQHAYFQMLHQGTDVIPVEFLVVKPQAPAHEQAIHAVAQAATFMHGRPGSTGHQAQTGNRPSIFFILEKLAPAPLGALLALHEHRVFVSGALWGINSFDQWGVECGKVVAQDIEKRLQSQDLRGFDTSTQGLLQALFG